jgi:aspartate racemase
MKTIGIIGGAGVIAANSLLEHIEKIGTAQGAYRDHHHPEIIMLHATQAPSRSLFLEGRGPSFVPAYITACQRLIDAGAEVLAMCCNTAHAAYFELAAKSRVPIINMIGETIEILSANPDTMEPIGLLCSDGTKNAQIYEKHARALKVDLRFMYPSENDQRDVTAVIQMIKRGLHRNSRETHAMLAKAAHNLKASGAGTIVLACTELHLASSEPLMEMGAIDTVEVLAQACIRRSGVVYVAT